MSRGTGYEKTKRNANVSDVAKAAEVSVATVSRAFNIPDAVRPEVRKRVLAAASSLGYSPNAAAKALRMQRTNIAGVVIPTLDYAIYARMVNSFQNKLSAAGHMVFVATTGWDNAHIFERVRPLIDRGAEGLLLVGAIEDNDLREYLKDKRLPVVTSYSYQINDTVPSIGFDNYAATAELVDYLIRLGHRRLAMISAPTKGNDRQRARVQAFRDTLAENGIDETDIVLERHQALTNGADAMREIHAQHPEVTAVVCSSDVLAFGALAECKKLGIHVPKDLSITGFDDFDFSALLDPPLTTISVPASEMGERAADALLNALTTSRAIQSVKLETNLVIRKSTSHPPKAAK
jgi:LacI family transcriptional regulator